MILRNFLTVAITLLVFIMMVFPEPAKAGGRFVFKDVDPGGAYTPYIMFLSEKGVIKGYPDGTFGPEKSLTRAEVVTALCVASGMTPSVETDTVFNDVPADHWAAGYISAGVKSGILKGYPNGTFLPENMVSRAELAALLINLSGLEISSSVTEIPDVPEQHWARGVIDAAVRNKLFLSSPGLANFVPDSPASRDVFARGVALAVTSSPKLGTAVLTGQVSSITGKIWLIKEGKETKLGSASAIFPGNQIRTGDDGEAEISFKDGTAILIKPNTRVIINKAKGRLGIGEDGGPVVLADELEIKLDYGTIIGICINRIPKETAYFSERNAIASAVMDGQIFAGYTGPGNKGRGTVNVVMPWGTVSANGLFVSEVTSSSQSTSVLVGQASVLANGAAVTVKKGETTTISSSGSRPGTPSPATGSVASIWSTNQRWIVARADRIERVRLVNVNPTPTVSPVAGPKQPQVSLLEEVGRSINSVSDNSQSKPTAGGGGGGGGTPPAPDPAPVQVDPGVDLRMDYNSQAGGYLVNIYMGSLANANYIEYTFEYDNTKLVHKSVNPDLGGILTVFGGHGLSLSDILNDSGWLVSGNKTHRTIKSSQLSTPLNYSGSRARLLSMDYERINPGTGAAVVSIKNIKVSSGSTTKNMPDVIISLP